MYASRIDTRIRFEIQRIDKEIAALTVRREALERAGSALNGHLKTKPKAPKKRKTTRKKRAASGTSHGA